MESSDIEIISSNGFSAFGLLQWLCKAFELLIIDKLWAKGIIDIAKKAKKIGEDDPRRIFHSLKVGVALTLISLFYYFEPLYNGCGFGMDAMWAVLTVVVVFEFSVGETLGKGINRTLATIFAGGLGVGAHHLATLCGKIGEPILVSTFVFTVAVIMTFIRFIPRMKARYDYGVTIFILTFCLISVSGYRDDQVLKIAHKRISTIVIGSFTSILVSVFIFPVWIGEDLHNLTANNILKLADFLQGFAEEYFGNITRNDIRDHDKSFLEGYVRVLTTKNIEDTMANSARWEPRHGRFRFHHPWKQYIKVGSLTRECAYKFEVLNSYLNSRTQTSMQIRSKIEESCKTICIESSKTLKELAATIKKMRLSSSSANSHIACSNNAIENLKSLLKMGILWEEDDNDDNNIEITHVIAVASLLIEVVKCTEKIAEAVHEMASLAHFNNMDTTKTSPTTKIGTSLPDIDNKSLATIAIE